MNSTLVRVNPESVVAYQNDAQNKFTSIHSDLTSLINAVVDVHYFGPNAVSFKTQCGQLTTEFANKLSLELGGIVAAVNTATSNIASSLGAARMQLNWSPSPFTAPVPPAGDGSVDVDHSALGTLKTTVSAKFEAISGLLDGHLSSLSGTDWVGVAKTTVVEEVTARTTHVKGTITEATTQINNRIQQQIDAVIAADKA